MPYAKLTLTIPDSVWMSTLSASHPETTFRVTAATATADSGVARIELHGDDPATVREAMGDYEAVTDLAVLHTGPGPTQVQVETTAPLLLTALQNSGVPLEMPFDVRDGDLALELTVPRETLSTLGDTLDDAGVSYEVEEVRQHVESEPALLTDRQQWVLEGAIDRGYYDTPRRTTLVDLAADLGIAKSTCSDILHRAEERVIKAHHGSDDTTGLAPAVSQD